MGGVGALSIAASAGCLPRRGVEAPAEFPEASEYGGQEVEATVDSQTGEVTVNPDIVMRHSACVGCYSSCGNRVKINKKTGEIMRVLGNPYSPNNAEPHLPYEASLEEGYLAFSTYQDKGHKGRATICARGSGTLESHYDPMRILVPLKRTGGRGEGKWKPITWEEAVNETVEGGKLFTEAGEEQIVEGFRQIRDLKSSLDPEQPKFGPKANQLIFNGGRGDGRTAFATRFMAAFGSVNYYSHAYS